MPWLSLILALLTFLAASKSDPKNKSKALLAGAAVGLGSYSVTHGTDWGQANLGELDGLVGVDTPPSLDANGDPVIPGYTTTTSPDGTVVRTPVPGFVNEAGSVLRSWGGTGTAAVVGTTDLAARGTLSKYFPLILMAGAAFLILK